MIDSESDDWSDGNMEDDSEYWTDMVTARLIAKCTDTRKKRKWLSDGLKLFNVDLPGLSTAEMCGELSHNLLYETDNEDDDEDDNVTPRMSLRESRERHSTQRFQ